MNVKLTIEPPLKKFLLTNRIYFKFKRNCLEHMKRNDRTKKTVPDIDKGFFWADSSEEDAFWREYSRQFEEYEAKNRK